MRHQLRKLRDDVQALRENREPNRVGMPIIRFITIDPDAESVGYAADRDYWVYRSKEEIPAEVKEPPGYYITFVVL